MYPHHQATIEKLAQHFQPDQDCLALLIIGSVARGEARADSDIDFYLVLTEEAYRKRQAAGALTIDLNELAAYPNGQASGTPVDLQFMQACAEHGPEPMRFAFQDTIIAMSRLPNLETLVQQIAAYPEHERLEKMKSFVSQLPVHLSYMVLAERSSNPYLLAETAVELVLFGGRLLLAHNHMLYPNRKQFLTQLEKAPQKPADLLDLAAALLTAPGIQTATDFYDAVMNFSPWPQPTEGSMARFKQDRELNWQKGNTPLADS